jgi:hypothetical protein
LIEKPQGKHERSPNMLQLSKPCFLSAKSRGWFGPFSSEKENECRFCFPVVSHQPNIDSNVSNKETKSTIEQTQSSKIK